MTLLMVACATRGAAPKTVSPQTPATPTSLDGVWRTDGYGYELEFSGERTMTFRELTTTSCVSGGKATRMRDADGIASYQIDGAPIVLRVGRRSSHDEIQVHIDGRASDIVARRAAPSTLCTSPVRNTPEANFEVFATTWAENYPFFAAKHVDWKRVVAENRLRITEQTSAPALFDILQGMIAPLGDAHAYILAPSLERQFQGFREAPVPLGAAEAARALGLVDKHLSRPLQSFCNGQVEFGRLASDVGFLRIRSFGNYGGDGSFGSDLTALEQALDAGFADASTWRALVFDLRINGGGADGLALAVVSRLTASEYPAFAKQARRAAAEIQWTPEQAVLAKPASRASFYGPVVELMGPNTVSAAEVLTQSLLGRSPNVVRIGQNTQGVFSDVLDRTLPNGWRFGLPNERYVTANKSYDGVGIAPDKLVPVFPTSDLDRGRDSNIDLALTLIAAR